MTDQNHFFDDTSAADWDAIARYVAGEGTPDERAATRRLLDAHPARANLLNAIDDVVRFPEPVAPTSAEIESALASVLARRDMSVVRGDAPRQPVLRVARRGTVWTSVPMRVAAAILVVAGAGLIYQTFGSKTPTQVAAAPQHFASAVGALDSLKLPDGTRVLLGPGSELTLGDRFGADVRDVHLKGEAKFEVVHDGAHPFIVHTANASFRDVGTVFSVHSDATDGARIVVTEGSVAVESKGSEPVTLVAGDRASVADAGSVRVERASASGDDMAWTTGRLIFNDAPVAQVTADLRRWYGIDLTVDSSLSARTVNATFDRGGADGVGKVLAAVLGGRLEQNGNAMHIVAPSAATPRK